VRSSAASVAWLQRRTRIPEFFLEDGSSTTTDFGVFKMDLRPNDAHL
jgi:hypothetical protein